MSWFNPSYNGTETTVFLGAPLSSGSHTLTAVASVSNPDSAHLLERYRTSITITSASSSFGVSFRSPEAGATVNGDVNLAVDTLSRQPNVVCYYADGVLIGRITTAPFAANWNSRMFGDGVHLLTAVASTADGATARADLQVVVKNVSSFGISFRSPQTGATVKGVVGLSVNSSSGQPRVVRYYADGKLIGTISKVPFVVNWNSRKLKDGVHMLMLWPRPRPGSRRGRTHRCSSRTLSTA